MRHFPIFLDLRGQRVVVSGAGAVALAKLRLILKTEADVAVFGANAIPELLSMAADGQIALRARAVEADDLAGAALFYVADEDADAIARAKALGNAAEVLTNVVDNLDASQFITPAIVDRDPVTVAIGTEGAAPVLARSIKRDVEAMLPAATGLLARIAQRFRPEAEALPEGAPRRRFWSRFFFEAGPDAVRGGGGEAAEAVLPELLAEALARKADHGRVALVGAGPGDPDLLTRRAAALLHEADVVIHDRLVSPQILELARREAVVIEAGKTGFGASWKQDDINAEMIAQAKAGHLVVRLKGGDPVIFGRLDEETAALAAEDVPFEVVPGVTAASGAAASLGMSLTRRGRNSALRVLTAHDVDGFADQDWRVLAAPGAAAAVYMGKRAAGFLRGRLMMFGADPATPVTAVENATLPHERVINATLADLVEQLAEAEPLGPVVLLYGIQAREAAHALAARQEEAL